jgi:hypothetical protein
MGYEAMLIFPDRDGKNLVSQINGNPNWNLAYNFPNALVFLYNKNIESNQNRKVKIIPKNFILPSNEGK